MAECMLSLSNKPSPIEVSFLTAEDRCSWRHPLPYDFHYSEDWREKFVGELVDGTWREWRHSDEGDIDLAAHLTVLHIRGVALLGEPIAAAFPKVPRDDYLASILADVDKESCLHDVEKSPVYIILNLCRVYDYLCQGLVASKEEAGAWALQVLPPKLRPVVQKALAIYRGELDNEEWDRHTVLNFTESTRRLIETANGGKETAG